MLQNGNALISDAQFDQLENNLKGLPYVITSIKNSSIPSLPKDQIKNL